MQRRLVKEHINIVARVHKIQSTWTAQRIIYVIEKGNEHMNFADYIMDEVYFKPYKGIKEGDLVGLRCQITYDNFLKIQTVLRVIEGGARG